MLDYIGIAIGVILLCAAVFYLIFYAQADTFFTEFKEKFNTDGFGRRFYIIFILERIIVPGILMTLASLSYGNAPIIVIYGVIAIVIGIKQPYRGDKKNYRPIANCLIVVII